MSRSQPMRWRRGEVVVVPFPYPDPTTGQVVLKGRPALVVSGDWVNQHTADVICAAISSRQPAQPYPTDFSIQQGTDTFKRSGLKVSSIVKTAVLATLPKSSISRRIGRLNAADLQQVNQRLRQSVGLP